MNTIMPAGKARFFYFLNQVQSILQKAETSANPPLTVYTADMRTPLFMLEGLTRLYKKIHPHKFSKLNKLFKELEDNLGAIDYYDGFHKEFAEQKKIPKPLIDYMQKQKNKKIKTLRHSLKERKWTGKHSKRISKIIKKLDKADWPRSKDDTEKISEIYLSEIGGIIKKYKNTNLKFKNIETDVHELRRELRWLSIYPQALRGLMQLKVNNDSPEFLKKYLTPEIISSPYNKMPDSNGTSGNILLNNDYFYALSWMIAELGKLKDNGLRLEVVEESLLAVYKINTETESLAYSLCGEGQLQIPEILTRSQQIAQDFFNENILENIIAKK